MSVARALHKASAWFYVVELEMSTERHNSCTKHYKLMYSKKWVVPFNRHSRFGLCLLGKSKELTLQQDTLLKHYDSLVLASTGYLI